MFINTSISQKLYHKNIPVNLSTGIYKETILNIPVLTEYEKYRYRDEYQRDIGPLFWFMRILGVLPLCKNTQGIWIFKFKSWIMLYSFILYIMFVVFLVIYLHLNFTKLLFDGFDEFTQKILNVALIFALFLPAIMPFTWWPCARSSVTFWKEWNEFQCEFRHLTKKILVFKLRNRCLILTAIIVISEIFMVAFFNYYLYSFSLSLKPILQYIIFLYTRYLAGAFLLYSYLNCSIIVKAADETLCALRQDIAFNHNIAQSVSKYRILWLQLSKLTHSLGTSSSYNYCSYILFTFGLLTMLVYCFALTIKDWEAAMISFMDSAFLWSFLFILCFFGNAVTEKVGNRFSEEILTYNNTMNSLIAQEVNLFLKTIEHYPPGICLNGYIVVNKRLLVSLGSALVTYLVVLLQFYHSG